MPGVYISYPFCAQKCTYCNFASGVFPRALESEYLAALRAEISSHDWSWRPETLYLGGGTPSRIDPGALADLLVLIPGRPWREATIEAAPGGITAAHAVAWRAAGIDRVSLGVQSFVAPEIARTGRKHTAAIVRDEVQLLLEAGLANVNIDLIAGLAGQTRESWRESLDWIARIDPPHVSVYMLEVDEDSRLGREMLGLGARFGASETPSDDLVAELYETAVARLGALGLARYEISNFARPSAESAHNLKYWRLEPYIGFGADAHSFDGVARVANVETPAEYVARVGSGESPRLHSEPACLDEERFYVGLRLAEGVRPLADDWTRFAAPIRHGLDSGLLESGGGTLKLTARGFLLANEVFEGFVNAS